MQQDNNKNRLESHLNSQKFEDSAHTRELDAAKRNIKVEIRVWNSLRKLKRSNETFNDVILSLLKERTLSMGGENLKAIKYSRRTIFLQTKYKYEIVGVEFDYNDVKEEQSNFNLDLKIKKVFFGKNIMNPSDFFGVDNLRKHLNPAYLNIYFKCLEFSLKKEFKIASFRMISDEDFENIALWRKIYYDYSLSEDSFINDIEEPLKLSEEEPDEKIRENIKKSSSNSVWKIMK